MYFFVGHNRTSTATRTMSTRATPVTDDNNDIEGNFKCKKYFESINCSQTFHPKFTNIQLLHAFNFRYSQGKRRKG